MLELAIPKPYIHDLCKANGLIDLLTVIPPEEIVTKGIPFIRFKFVEGKFSSNFEFDLFLKLQPRTRGHDFEFDLF